MDAHSPNGKESRGEGADASKLQGEPTSPLMVVFHQLEIGLHLLMNFPRPTAQSDDQVTHEYL